MYLPPRRSALALLWGQAVSDRRPATPWAIEPDMLDTIRAIALREGEGVEARQAREGRPLTNARTVTMRDGVAVVPITGPIFRYANLFTQISGATSLDVLAKDFASALGNPEVRAIVLEINSPGGQATGISEFAAQVRAAAKPVVAYVDGMAASAAYWIAAAAPQIRDRIARAIDGLPDDQREVFLMRQVSGLSFKEIGEIVGAPENTVKSRMRYALDKLRTELADFNKD